MMHYEIAGDPQSATLAAIVKGVPAGLHVHENAVDVDVARWARANGCTDETPSVAVLSGLKDGCTTGAPILLALANGAYAERMEGRFAPRSVACPGSAEAAGSQKYGIDDLSVIDARCDARLDAMRVAASGIVREFLAELDVDILSCVTRIGHASLRSSPFDAPVPPSVLDIESSSCRCPSPQTTASMEIEIARAQVQGRTLPGEFRLGVFGLVPGLGELQRSGAGLAGRLAAAAFSIDGVTGIEFGAESRALQDGLAAHDTPVAAPGEGLARAANKAGGIEGGLSTGMPLTARVSVAAGGRIGCNVASLDVAALQPAPYIPTSFSCCDIPAKAVVAESEAAFVLADAYLQKFGGDSMDDIHDAVAAYRRRLAMAR